MLWKQSKQKNSPGSLDLYKSFRYDRPNQTIDIGSSSLPRTAISLRCFAQLEKQDKGDKK